MKNGICMHCGSTEKVTKWGAIYKHYNKLSRQVGHCKGSGKYPAVETPVEETPTEAPVIETPAVEETAEALQRRVKNLPRSEFTHLVRLIKNAGGEIVDSFIDDYIKTTWEIDGLRATWFRGRTLAELNGLHITPEEAIIYLSEKK